jgi:hypothetical protein
MTWKMFCYLHCVISLCGQSRLLLFVCAVFGNVLHLFLTLRLVLHVEQKLLTLPEHPSSLPIYSVVRVVKSLIVL